VGLRLKTFIFFQFRNPAKTKLCTCTLTNRTAQEVSSVLSKVPRGLYLLPFRYYEASELDGCAGCESSDSEAAEATMEGYHAAIDADD